MEEAEITTGACAEETLLAAHRFALSVTLHRTLGVPAFADAASERTDATIGEFTVPVLVFAFDDEQQLAKAVAECRRRAEAGGNGLKEAPCVLDGRPGTILVLRDADCVAVDMAEKPNALDIEEAKPYVEDDMKAVAECTRITGVSIVYHHSGWLVQPPIAGDEGRVHLFAHARPPGLSVQDLMYKNLYGIPAWKDDAARVVRRPTAGRGRLIEESGVPVFQVLGSTYYQICLTHSEHHPFAARSLIFRRLLGTLARDLAEGSQEAPPVEEAEDEEFESFISERLDERLKALREEAEKIRFMIGEVERDLTAKLREQQNLTQMINALQASAFRSELRERLPEELRTLKDIPGVAAVRIADGGIHLETVPVVIEHGGRAYDLGIFTVRLDPERGKVAVWSDAPRHPEGHHHPHIDRADLACYGNVTTAIIKCMCMYRYADAARIVLRWLATYNPETTLIPIEGWATDAGANENNGAETKEAEHDGTDAQRVAAV